MLRERATQVNDNDITYISLVYNTDTDIHYRSYSFGSRSFLSFLCSSLLERHLRSAERGPG